MKKRRIDFHKHADTIISAFVLILEENEDHFVVEWDYGDPCVGVERKCFFDGSTWFKLAGLDYCHSAIITWKPHEYRQEARQSCLFAYWFLKRIIGKDPAGIIAKFVYSTRFEEIWENEEEEKN